VEKGNVFFTPSIARRFGHIKSPGSSDSPLQKAIQLTSREVEALQLIAEGRANKQIAAELGISIKTVEKHRQRLMQKLCIHDTAGLTRYAIAAGVIESSLQTTVVD
jgi:DNA-binding NarL/FixJ family response regulator